MSARTAGDQGAMAPQPLGGAEKAALLLLLLEEPEAAALLARLEPPQVEAVGRAMLNVAEASPATISALLDEVLALAGGTVALSDGAPTVRDLMGRALGPERADGMLGRLGEAAQPAWFAMLGWLDPAAIADLLADEHPQAAALMLTRMAPERAGAVLRQMPPAVQAELVRRVATMGPVTPGTLDLLDEALGARVRALKPRQPVADLGGLARAAALVGAAGLDEKLAVKAVADVAPALAEAFEAKLFTFDDLMSMPERPLQQLLRTVEAEMLVPALRAATPELKARLLGAMPQRAAQALEDEIDGAPPVRRDEALAAQAAIAAIARRMADAGELVLPGRGPDYV